MPSTGPAADAARTAFRGEMDAKGHVVENARVAADGLEAAFAVRRAREDAGAGRDALGPLAGPGAGRRPEARRQVRGGRAVHPAGDLPRAGQRLRGRSARRRPTATPRRCPSGVAHAGAPRPRPWGQGRRARSRCRQSLHDSPTRSDVAKAPAAPPWCPCHACSACCASLGGPGLVGAGTRLIVTPIAPPGPDMQRLRPAPENARDAPRDRHMFIPWACEARSAADRSARGPCAPADRWHVHDAGYGRATGVQCRTMAANAHGSSTASGWRASRRNSALTLG